jgi:hypothetical protein
MGIQQGWHAHHPLRSELRTEAFWDTTPCSLVDKYKCFGGTCCFRDTGVDCSLINQHIYLQNSNWYCEPKGWSTKVDHWVRSIQYYIFITYIPKNQFNIISSVSQFSEWYLCMRFSNQNSVITYAFSMCATCHIYFKLFDFNIPDTTKL